VSRGGITPVAADEIAARLAGTGRAVALGDWLVAPAAIQELSGRLIGMLQSHHTSEPLSDGLPREEARERVFGRAAPMVFDHVVSDLVARQRIVAKDRLALASHQLSLTPEEGRARDGIERVYREAGLAPPDAQTAQSAANVAPELWDRIVTLLLRQKTLVRIDALMFHADALARLRSDIRGLNVPGASGVKVDVAAFKERYGITRKYAIPLLEYLDRERITRRVGDSRIVL
jgi:selenocysteine-specific elongation factor